MSHPLTLNCSASELRKQLDADEFMQQLARTTLFQLISPANLPLVVVEEICKQNGLIPVSKNEHLKLDKPNLYEILSGYVKIYDRAPLPIDKISATRKEPPPALLAWRVPGELLGDFQFSIPHHSARDHIVATDACQLLMIPNSLVRTIARYEPQIYLNIAANLASKAVKARVRAQILRLPTIECKIAKLFLELLEERKTDPTIEDCNVVNGTFHIKDIAAFLGRGEHSTQQGIHQLIDNKVLDHYKGDRSGRFEVRDKDGLQRYLQRAWSEANKKRTKQAKDGKG